MSDDQSARLRLPLLHPGQAQKEMDHNEALAMIDIALQPAVVAVGVDLPPAAPVEGECWIVGGAPTGAWSGHAGGLAGWTTGGWRFFEARAGMAVWSTADGCTAVHDGAAWAIGRVHAARLAVGGIDVVGAQRPAIAEPVGGTTIDVAARETVSAILAALRAHGLIAV